MNGLVFWLVWSSAALMGPRSLAPFGGATTMGLVRLEALLSPELAVESGLPRHDIVFGVGPRGPMLLLPDIPPGAAPAGRLGTIPVFQMQPSPDITVLFAKASNGSVFGATSPTALMTALAMAGSAPKPDAHRLPPGEVLRIETPSHWYSLSTDKTNIILRTDDPGALNADALARLRQVAKVASAGQPKVMALVGALQVKTQKGVFEARLDAGQPEPVRALVEPLVRRRATALPMVQSGLIVLATVAFLSQEADLDGLLEARSQMPEDPFVDAWKHPLEIQIEARPGHGRALEVCSRGVDTKPGTLDDQCAEAPLKGR